MAMVWFSLVAFMIAGYVILDGFDLGVGVLHLFIAKTDEERRLLMRTIGPVWDGNEVWLLAGGGTLFFAFPLLYASSFSGFYLPLMMVLWLLIVRAIGIEFRTHLASPVWCGFFDACFGLASIFLCVLFGAALGNVIRGVPLHPDGYFFSPLWTNWRVGTVPGILDWYTVLAGVVALVALAIHGAHYVVIKTDGALQSRARRVARVLGPVLFFLTLLSLWATLAIRPQLRENYELNPLAFLIPAVVLLSLAGMIFFGQRGLERRAFLSSSLYLAAMLVGAAFGSYPVLLFSSGDPRLSITVHNAASASRALSMALFWWGFGMALAIGYSVFVYRIFRGKVNLEGEGHGY